MRISNIGRITPQLQLHHPRDISLDISYKTMGHSDSRPEERLSREQVSLLFAQKCAKQFSSIEIWSLKEIFNKHAIQESGVSYWTNDILLKSLSLPESSQVGEMLLKSASFLSSFPFLQHDPKGPLTVEGLVKVLAFYNKRYKGLLKNHYDIVKLLFLSFSGPPEKKKDNEEPQKEEQSQFSFGDVEVWDEFSIVKQLEEVPDTMAIPAHDMYELFTFLLEISDYSPPDSLTEHYHNLSQDSKLIIKYKNSALCLLRSMHPEITTVSSLEGISITFYEFREACKAAYPHIFDPLGNLFDQLLFNTVTPQHDKKQTTEEPSPTTPAESFSSASYTTSKLMTPNIMAQLSMFMGNVSKDMVRLYAGSDAGFSMRSFENRVFKWQAPTILLVSGKTMGEASNSRQRSFDDMIPAARMMHHQDSSPSVQTMQSDASSSAKSRRKVTFGIFIETPWRASSKECFANNKTVLFQLAPCQDVFLPNITPSNYVYCTRSQPGPGGIGAGSVPPTMVDRHPKFALGNVSLTIEETLEFGVFRHLGGGGSFDPSRIHPLQEFEERFAIDEIEVWGCGNEEDLAKQKKEWEWEKREAEYRQRVNISGTGNHAEDRALLEMAGLVGQHQSGGSV